MTAVSNFSPPKDVTGFDKQDTLKALTRPELAVDWLFQYNFELKLCQNQYAVNQSGAHFQQNV